MQYLGWEIRKDGLALSNQRCEVIRKFKPCKNVRDVRALLGAVNYFHKMIPRLSTITYPLYQLLRRGVKFQWGKQENDALEAIKEALTSGRVLAWPREKDQETCPYILEVDASPYGLGCLLKQDDGTGTE